MRVTRTFDAPVPESVAREQIVAFLARAGYRRLSDSGGGLRFRRGSIFGTLTNFDPTRWACAINVRLAAKASKLAVDAQARMASDPFERRFAGELLATELSRLEAAVTANGPGPLDFGDLRRRVRAHVYRVVGLFASLIFPALLGILAATMTMAVLGASQAAAALTGAVVFLALIAACFVVWSRQKKEG